MSPITLHTPILIQPASGDPSLVTTGQEFRNYNRAMLAMIDNTGAQGVSSNTAYQVTQHGGGANLTVDVASGQAYVVGDDVTSQGTYHVWNDATVNVPGITVPVSGTFHHRIVLQIQDHLENGAWTAGTYQGVMTPLLDTGGGLPAEPNSALTVATIDVPTGSASITNSMINDYRVVLGVNMAFKAADTARSSTTALADDPDLQLVNLAPSARYEVHAEIVYVGGSGASEGDLQYTWRTSSSPNGYYAVQQNNVANNFQQVVDAWPSNLTGGGSNFAGTNGVTSLQACVFDGQYQTSSSRPAFLVFQWAQNTSKGTATTVKAGSYVTARRIG